jgi:hypothetical protein
MWGNRPWCISGTTTSAFLAMFAVIQLCKFNVVIAAIDLLQCYIDCSIMNQGVLLTHSLPDFPNLFTCFSAGYGESDTALISCVFLRPKGPSLLVCVHKFSVDLSHTKVRKQSCASSRSIDSRFEGYSLRQTTTVVPTV